MRSLVRTFRRLWRRVRLSMHGEYEVAAYYRSITGVTIGDGCRIMDRRLNLFGSEPYLISIGNRVTLAEGVRLITHDGAAAVLRDKYPGLNVYGKIEIRDNCFIGVGAIVMPGISIGPNSIIGAGAVVTSDVPPGTVVGGVPARKLCSLIEYEERALRKGIKLDGMIGQARDRAIRQHVRS